MIIPAGTPEKTSLLYGLTYPVGTDAELTTPFATFAFGQAINWLSNVFAQGSIPSGFEGSDKAVITLTYPDTTVVLVDVFLSFGEQYHLIIKEGKAIAYLPNGGSADSVSTFDLNFDEEGESYLQRQVLYFEPEGLTPGVDSFAVEDDLIKLAQRRLDLPALGQYLSTDLSTFRTAIMNAYDNIGLVRVNIQATPDNIVSTTNDLDLAELGMLTERVRKQLMLATLIEANYLLGGDPIEERRKAGLLSHSAGESTHFFQTSKPVALPVSRKTMDAMKGLVNWTAKVSR
jgi:hypothetical protein